MLCAARRTECIDSGRTAQCSLKEEDHVRAAEPRPMHLSRSDTCSLPRPSGAAWLAVTGFLHMLIAISLSVCIPPAAIYFYASEQLIFGDCLRWHGGEEGPAGQSWIDSVQLTDTVTLGIL
jgi:hypothetical protein